MNVCINLHVYENRGISTMLAIMINEISNHTLLHLLNSTHENTFVPGAENGAKKTAPGPEMVPNVSLG
jgi:hypothetical protein